MKITQEQVSKREKAFEMALAINAIEGVSPDKNTYKLAKEWIRGKITAEEWVSSVLKKYEVVQK